MLSHITGDITFSYVLLNAQSLIILPWYRIAVVFCHMLFLDLKFEL